MSVNKYDPTTGLLTPVAGTENVVFGGATASTDGTRGLVPAPSAGDEGKALMADGTWDYAGELSWTGTLAQWNALSSSEKAEYVGKKIYITDDYETEGIPNFTGATASSDGTAGLVPQPHAGDEDKVLQGNGTFGKKLQMDVVVQNNQYGYINGSNQFVAFKSQADIDAAVSAAKVGTAVAADVLEGKTFTNSTTSGVTGTMPSRSNGEAAVSTDRANGNRVFFPRGHYPNYATHDGQSYVTLTDAQVVNFANKQEKTVTATDSTIAVTPDSGKLLSKVNINPKLRFQGGRLDTRKNIDGWDNTWSTKTWSGLTNFSGRGIWSDGTNIYYSSGSTQKILNKSNSTWSTKTWSGLTSFDGLNIWSDGTNIYYSSVSTQYVLNKSNSTWSTKTWSGLTNFYGRDVWTDGTNIYCSYVSTQYVLNKSNSTWSTKTWSGLTNFYGRDVWTDGTNIYCSSGSTQYVLNKSNSTWSTKTWKRLTNFYGRDVWTDGTNIYYSNYNSGTDSSTQCILNTSISTWLVKTWSGFTNLRGDSIWTDGTNIYYSDGGAEYQYVLNKVKTHWAV